MAFRKDTWAGTGGGGKEGAMMLWFSTSQKLNLSNVFVLKDHNSSLKTQRIQLSVPEDAALPPFGGSCKV